MSTIDSKARGFRSTLHHITENKKAQRYLRSQMRGADRTEKARLQSLIAALESEMRSLRGAL